jgi:hypothetical protein
MPVTSNNTPRKTGQFHLTFDVPSMPDYSSKQDFNSIPFDRTKLWKSGSRGIASMDSTIASTKGFTASTEGNIVSHKAAQQ